MSAAKYKKPKAKKMIAFEGVAIARRPYDGPGAPSGKPRKSELKRLKKEGLANWPPSRGPLPAHLDAARTLAFPPVTVAGPYAYDSAVQVAREMEFSTPPKRRKKKQPYPDSKDRQYLSIGVWQQVTQLLTVDPLVASNLVRGTMADTDVQHIPSNRTYHAELGYPLSGIARVKIKPFVRQTTRRDRSRQRKDMTIGWLLWALAQAYEAIYADQERYGIWGHHIGDLTFEQIVIKGDQVWVGVGS